MRKKRERITVEDVILVTEKDYQDAIETNNIALEEIRKIGHEKDCCYTELSDYAELYKSIMSQNDEFRKTIEEMR